LNLHGFCKQRLSTSIFIQPFFVFINISIKGDLMKKLLGCFLCVMLLFALATTATADMLVPDGSSIWDNPDNLPNSSIGLEQDWLNSLLGNPDPPVELLYIDEDPSDGWQPPADWAYAVLKYGIGQAPYSFEHWAIVDDGDGILQLGDVGSNPDGGRYILDFHALSHVSYDAPAPESATILLIGIGLVGLAGLGRKRLKKGLF
jgi:hypothetical protein